MKSRDISAMTVGLNIVGGIIAGLIVGYFVDWAAENWFGYRTSPWGLLIFFFIGIISGFRNAYRDMKRTLPLLLLLPTLTFPSEERKEKIWSVHIELSYVKTSGNVDTQTLSEKLELKRKGNTNRLYFRNYLLYATQEGKETASRLDVNGRWERLFTERFFGFLTAGYERDRFSGYEYRINGGPGIGYDLLKTKNHELKVLLSAPYYYNKVQNGPVDSYGTARAEVYYQWSILENLKLKQSTSYFLNLSDSKTYFLSSETSIEVRVNNHISLGVGYRLAYQNRPPEPGIKRTDTTFSTSLIIDL